MTRPGQAGRVALANVIVRQPGFAAAPATGIRRPEGDRLVAMTAEVKDELSRLSVTQVQLSQGRGVRAAALRRRAAHRRRPGGRRSRGGPRLDRASAAPRDLRALRLRRRRPRAQRGWPAQEFAATSCGSAKDGEALARQTGLLDVRGRPVRGLPAQVVGGSVGDAEAAWRGAFLAHGSLTEPGRSSALEISCPGPGSGARARRRGAPSRRSRPRRARCAAPTGW